MFAPNMTDSNPVPGTSNPKAKIKISNLAEPEPNEKEVRADDPPPRLRPSVITWSLVLLCKTQLSHCCRLGKSIQKDNVVNKTSSTRNKSPLADERVAKNESLPEDASLSKSPSPSEIVSLPENESPRSLHENENTSEDVSLYENDRPVTNASSPKDGNPTESASGLANTSLFENVCDSNPRVVIPVSVDIDAQALWTLYRQISLLSMIFVIT
ncbi:hypothetical protein J6590_011008 [Homalodisca vitripennis]|nr:hypothetical protein J6590_011008 [Homalodisca vitripennis]